MKSFVTKITFSVLLFLTCSSHIIVGQGAPMAFVHQSMSGPRSAALGLAFTAVANDPSAIYFNPAGLSQLSQTQFQVMSQSAFETQYISAETVFSWAKLPIGIGLLGASSQGAEETVFDSGTYVPTGETFGYHAAGLYLASAFSPLKDLSVGGNFKYFTESLSKNTASGIGADFGLLYSLRQVTVPYLSDIQLGFSIQNLLAPNMQWNNSTSQSLPSTFAYGLSFKTLEKTLLISTDLRQEGSHDMTLHAGIEYVLQEKFAIRAGLNDERLSVGIGLDLDFISLQYAMHLPHHNEKDLLDNTHRFGIGFRL